MNKVYRVIFNRSLGVYQCVSEIAKSVGKSKSIKTLSLAVAVALSTQALAQNQDYTNGDVTNLLEDVYTADGDIISHRSIVNGKTVDVKSRTLNVTDLGVLNTRAIRTGNGSRTNIESGASVVSDNVLMEDNSLVSLTAASLGSPSASLQLGVNPNNPNNTSVISATAKSAIHAQEVFVGYLNNGQLNVDGGSTLQATQRINIGNRAEGKVVVAGEGSAIKADSATIRVGDGNKGELLLQDGAMLNARKLDAGYAGAGEGQITVKGEQSALQIQDDATIGKEGNATLNVFKQANANINNNTFVGLQQGSTGTVNLFGDNAPDDKTKLTVGGDLNIGVAGEGTLNITDGAALQVNTEISLGKAPNGVGNITMRRGKLEVTNQKGARYGDLLVGDIGGTGHLTATENSTISLAKDLVIGHQENAIGRVLIDNSQANIGGNLFVGKQGFGELTLQNKADVTVGANINGDNQSVVYIGGKSNRTGQKSTLTLKDASLQARSVTVGQDGAARLVLGKDSVLKTYLIERGNHEDVNVILDGATITTPDSLVAINAYFRNFTDKQNIEIKDGGVNFLINDSTAQLATTGKITGNGTLTKSGAGKLVFAGDTKDWRGGINIEQGVVTIQGNYTMGNDEMLQIAINKPNDYGKLEVQGKADIAKGILTIKTADALSGIKNGEFKDVLVAQQLVGQFKEVQNNNPLIAFQAKYDNNKVHLAIKPPTEIIPGLKLVPAPKKPEPPAPQPKDPEPKPEIIPGLELVPAPKKPEPPAPQPKDPEPKPEIIPGLKLVPAPKKPEPPAPQPKDPEPKPEIIPGLELVPAPKKPEPPAPKPKDPEPKPEIIPGLKLVPAPKKPEPPAPQPKDLEPAPKPPVEQVPNNPPMVDLPIAEIEVVPNNPPVVEKPNLDLPQAKFAPAAEQFDAHRLLDLAHTLDKAYIEAYTDLLLDEKNRKNNALGQALLKDGDHLGGKGLSKTQIAHNLNQVNAQLQPLLMGAVNETLLNSHQQRVDSTKSHIQSKGIWAAATNSEHDKQALAGGLTGYSQKDKGITLGAATTVGTANVGLALSYSDSDVKANTVNHRADIKTAGATLYAAKAYGNTVAYGHVDVSKAKIKGERQIEILKAGTAKSNYDASTYGVGFGVRHRIGTASRHIAPFAQVGYAQVTSDAYRETGTNYALNVDKAKQHSFYHQAGVAWQYALTPKFAVSGAVSGVYNNGDDGNKTHAHFASTPSASFGVVSNTPSRYAGLGKVGLTYQPTANTKLGISYQGQWQKGANNQGVNIGASFVF